MKKAVTPALLALGILTGAAFLSFSEPQHDVWICSGKYSKRYHATEDGCKGMRACKGDKFKVTLQQALEMGRTPCGFCY